MFLSDGAFDVLLIDTAGRLQNRTELMDELEEMIRVMKKVDATAPHAVAAQATIASLFLLFFDFEALTDNVVFISFLMYALAAVGLMVLRRKRPDLPRPYRTVGYPVVPLVFLAASVLMLLNAAIEQPHGEGLLGLALRYCHPQVEGGLDAECPCHSHPQVVRLEVVGRLDLDVALEALAIVREEPPLDLVRSVEQDHAPLKALQIARLGPVHQE